MRGSRLLMAVVSRHWREAMTNTEVQWGCNAVGDQRTRGLLATPHQQKALWCKFFIIESVSTRHRAYVEVRGQVHLTSGVSL